MYIMSASSNRWSSLGMGTTVCDCWSSSVESMDSSLVVVEEGGGVTMARRCSLLKIATSSTPIVVPGRRRSELNGVEICNVSFVICHLSFVIFHLSFVMCHLVG